MGESAQQSISAQAQHEYREGGTTALRAGYISAAVMCYLFFLHNMFICYITNFKVMIEIIINRKNDT